MAYFLEAFEFESMLKQATAEKQARLLKISNAPCTGETPHHHEGVRIRISIAPRCLSSAFIRTAFLVLNKPPRDVCDPAEWPRESHGTLAPDLIGSQNPWRLHSGGTIFISPPFATIQMSVNQVFPVIFPPLFH